MSELSSEFLFADPVENHRVLKAGLHVAVVNFISSLAVRRPGSIVPLLGEQSTLLLANINRSGTLFLAKYCSLNPEFIKFHLKLDFSQYLSVINSEFSPAAHPDLSYVSVVTSYFNYVLDTANSYSVPGLDEKIRVSMQLMGRDQLDKLLTFVVHSGALDLEFSPKFYRVLNDVIKSQRQLERKVTFLSNGAPDDMMVTMYNMGRSDVRDFCEQKGITRCRLRKGRRALVINEELFNHKMYELKDLPLSDAFLLLFTEFSQRHTELTYLDIWESYRNYIKLMEQETDDDFEVDDLTVPA